MNICIIGAGTMGAGIAQVFIVGGYETVLCDMTVELAEQGRAGVEKRLNRLAAKDAMTEEAVREAMSRISTGTVESAADCGLVLEAVREDGEVKTALFRQLGGLCPPESVFASNTSSLSITELSAAAGRPVVGLHFFNPAPVMKLVEVVSGHTTPPELAERMTGLARKLGKTPVPVAESPGFVVNRLLIPMINEAAFLVMEGVASTENIDAAMKLGANHPLGPLALGDLIGLDVVLSIMETLQAETGDDKYRPCPLLRRMVRGGQLGRKSDNGFFVY